MLREIVATDYLRVLPYSDGFLLNDIPVSLENVARVDYRVDLERGGMAAFLVEHVLGCLLLAGVTSARVQGTSTSYDLARQTHRDAQRRGLPSSTVLGNPIGNLDPELYGKLRASVEEEAVERVSVRDEVTLSSEYGDISITPSDSMEVKVVSGRLRYEFSFEEGKLGEIVGAKTPYLEGITPASIPHVVGDVIGDIWGIGGINCGSIEIHPGREYHRLTIGILEKVERVSLP